MGLSGGNVARKRLPRRKLNLVDADTNALSFLVNSSECLFLTKERFQLVAELTELKAINVAEKARNKDIKAQQKQEKASLK